MRGGRAPPGLEGRARAGALREPGDQPARRDRARVQPAAPAEEDMIERVDHIVLTTRDKDACIRFYSVVLGMDLVRFKTPTEERLALKFGSQKINLHEWGKEIGRAHV